MADVEHDKKVDNASICIGETNSGNIVIVVTNQDVILSTTVSVEYARKLAGRLLISAKDVEDRMEGKFNGY